MPQPVERCEDNGGHPSRTEAVLIRYHKAAERAAAIEKRTWRGVSRLAVMIGAGRTRQPEALEAIAKVQELTLDTVEASLSALEELLTTNGV